VVELLITAEADVNKTTPTTPLNAAANGVGWRHAPAVVKLLIEAGADVDKVGAGGATPLSCAAWVGRGQHLVPPGSPFTSPSQDLILPVLSFPCVTSTSRLFTALSLFPSCAAQLLAREHGCVKQELLPIEKSSCEDSLICADQPSDVLFI